MMPTFSMNTVISHTDTDEDFAFIRDIVYRLSRISLGPHKKPMVLSRIAKRIRVLGLGSVREYCELLRKPSGQAELSSLIDVISTNHTYFFRETTHFDYLTREILRHQRGIRREPFRIWSAACSSGEEPYSVAMILGEQSRIDAKFKWQMEATDISSTVLEKAKKAEYPKTAISRVPQVLQDRYLDYLGSGERVAVKENLKRHIHYSRLNLLDIPSRFPNKFDLILCRNVMIYFDRQTREELINEMTGRLTDDGHLFVGHSESLGGLNHRLRMVQPAVYVKES
ncbi:MAG: protein-glutamate O-methyltransferase CheR [Puniceicoccaceae bacterium]